MASPLRRAVRERIRPAIQSLTRHEVTEALRQSPSLVAKVLPIDPECDILRVPGPSAGTPRAPDDLPLPPPELHELDDYLTSGERHMRSLTDLLARVGHDRDSWGDVLDFGCGSARLTRHFVDHAVDHAVWGVDISAPSIAWCEGHLSPPLRFAPCTTFPHLPFEDDTFGLVFAGSVFSHISELAMTWLLELRRITRPGGVLVLTVQDQACARLYRDEGAADHWTTTLVKDQAETLDRLGRDLEYVSFDRSNKNAMVFYDRAYLERTWGRALDLVSVVERAYDFQTAMVLRKHPRKPTTNDNAPGASTAATS